MYEKTVYIIIKCKSSKSKKQTIKCSAVDRELQENGGRNEMSKVQNTQVIYIT